MKTIFSKTAEAKILNGQNFKTQNCPILCNVSGGQTPS